MRASVFTLLPFGSGSVAQARRREVGRNAGGSVEGSLAITSMPGADDAVDGVECGGIKSQIGTVKKVVELFHGAGADDHRGHERVLHRPRGREMGEREDLRRPAPALRA